MTDETKEPQISCNGHNGQTSVASHYRVLSPLSGCLILHRLRGELIQGDYISSMVHSFLKDDFKGGCQILAQLLFFSGELF